MQLSNSEAFILVVIMGLVVMLCRFLPIIILRLRRNENNATESQTKKSGAFMLFIEKVAPPVTMSVLAISAVLSPVKKNFQAEALPVLAAAAVTALTHLWKKNTLFSIVLGTAAYVALKKSCSM